MENSILTVQLGNMSNWIGSHFWNLISKKSEDESFNNFMRQNVEEPSPRLLAVDLSANMSLPSPSGDSNDFEEETECWDKVKKIVRNSSNECALWNKCFDPQMARLHFQKDYFMPFNEYFDLPEITENSKEFSKGVFYYFDTENDFPVFIEEFENNLRRLCEETDYLTGFNLLFDSSNGFSGIFTFLTDYLNEEFTKKSSITFPIYHEKTIDDLDHSSLAFLKTLNILESKEDFLTSSVYAPIVFDYSRNICTDSLQRAKVISNFSLPFSIDKKLNSDANYDMRSFLDKITLKNYDKKMFSTYTLEEGDAITPLNSLHKMDLSENYDYVFSRGHEEGKLERTNVIQSFCQTKSSYHLKSPITCEIKSQELENVTTYLNSVEYCHQLQDKYDKIFSTSSSINSISSKIRIPRDDLIELKNKINSLLMEKYAYEA